MKNSNQTVLAVIKEKIENIEEKIVDFVTKVEFEATVQPLRAIVYGIVAIMGIAVMGALLKLILK